MLKTTTIVGLGLVIALWTGCATNLGTGPKAVQQLAESYPITVGKLLKAEMDSANRLRIYLKICEDATLDQVVCNEDGFRVLAMVESNKTDILERLATRYLQEGAAKPVYVYGPMCEGLEELVVVPHCQLAMAVGVWDPTLKEYIVYSPTHGSGGLLESEGFNAFLNVTGRAVGTARKVAF